MKIKATPISSRRIGPTTLARAAYVFGIKHLVKRKIKMLTELYLKKTEEYPMVQNQNRKNTFSNKLLRQRMV